MYVKFNQCSVHVQFSLLNKAPKIKQTRMLIMVNIQPRYSNILGPVIPLKNDE